MPLAEVNGGVITAADLERALGTRLASLEEKIYALKQRELDTLIGERLLEQEAVKRGVPQATLLDKEVTGKVSLVTEADVEKFYHANKSSLGEDGPAIRQQIRSYLQQQRLTAQRNQFVNSLRSNAKVQVMLPPPLVHQVEVRLDGDLVRGASDGVVSIVEFSDYHCPFCKQVQPTLSELLAKYPDRVRFLFRDFPLERLHPQAFRAAEAARCARDQGKFWEYHDILFEEAPKAEENDLKRYATQVGLDREKFTSCLFQNVHHQAVQQDLDEGSRLGLDGTPAFFVNGRFLSGAQPLEEFVRVIDEELARVDKRAQVSGRTQ
jgi:protein-disulfide isomerase